MHKLNNAGTFKGSLMLEMRVTLHLNYEFLSLTTNF